MMKVEAAVFWASFGFGRLMRNKKSTLPGLTVTWQLCSHYWVDDRGMLVNGLRDTVRVEVRSELRHGSPP